jgi:hypothetical protein
MPSWLQGVNAELIRVVILTSYDAATQGAGVRAGAAPHLIFVWNPTFEI